VGRPRLLVAALLVALPIATHLLTVDESVRPIAVAVGWVTSIAIALGLARGFRVTALETAAVVGAIGAAWYLSAGARYAIFVPPVAINALLLWLFGRTLVPGREPLVSSIARLVRGELAPELARYTRCVTWAWCVFFAVMAGISICLAAYAPLAVWSLFANVLVYPLVALMLVAEYAYRRLRFPDYQHFPPLAVLKRIAEAR